MSNDFWTIDNKYIIISEKGGGGYSVVYHVKDAETQKEYAAKVITYKSSTIENEVKFCKIIHTFQNPYIIDFITNGIGPIQKGEIIAKELEYYIFEYASKGDLWQYINQGKFEEKYSKHISLKILKGIQELHKNGICHRDIKPQNILLDDNFNPKICDFGFAESIKGEDGSEKLYKKLGTDFYLPPQMYDNESYNGIKADIFSLGVTLFILITRKPCFYEANKKDKFYNAIIKKKGYSHYMKKNKIKLSHEFLNLFYKMVAYKESDRPNNIQEIIDDEWFKEITDLNNEEKMILEEQVRLEFEKRENEINKKTKLEENTEQKEKIEESDIYEYFNDNINIKLIKEGIEMDNYMKINGKLNPIQFMNNLADKINILYECEIEPSQDNLTFKVIFKKKEEGKEEEENEEEEFEEEEEIEEKNEEEKENEEEDADNEKQELDFDNIKPSDKVCIIEIELFRYEQKEKFLLRLIKKSGDLNDYYKNLLNILEQAKKLIKY